jgi:energy-coupling factor transporter ATP-binding protein EcfA2
MPESPIYDVFVSYAEADCAWVEGYLLEALKQADVRCINESAFALGVPRLLEFERAIKQSKRTLLIISANYLADGLNEFIATMGQSYGQDTNAWPVIPLLREVVPLPPRLGMLVGLKATNETEQESAIAQLCADLKRPIPASEPPPDCPYPGMKPFGLSDCDRFFGRDQEIENLLERLRLHPFITVIGPSGSGKSSLVFAGLIPALQKSRLFGSGGWRIESMRPGEAPETTLRQILTEQVQNDTRLLLIVDQFEELFTLAKEEAVPFQESLLKLTKTPHVFLVLTVRADFYSDLMTSLLWQEIQNYRVEVVPLNDTELRQAILKPAEKVGVFVEPTLIERLVTDAAGEPGVLPLIQETLVLLWQKLERRFLPLRAYEALILPRSSYGGQETGQKTGLQVAIARRADQALRELKDDPEKQQAIARRIFLRLVQFGEGRADTRRQQSVEDLRAMSDDPSLFQNTLNQFVNSRLLTLSGEEREVDSTKIDIAHEALITGWPTFQQWISVRRDAEKTRRNLSEKATEWTRLGRNAGLLDQVELAEAEQWLASADAVDLGDDEALSELLAASRAAIQKALNAERRRNQVIIGSLSSLLILGSIAGGFAWEQQRQSQKALQVITDVSLGIQMGTREVIEFLPQVLNKAKEEKDQERAIAYYRQVLMETKKLKQPDQKLSPKESKIVAKLDQDAYQSLISFVINARIPVLRKQINQGLIGERISGKHNDLDKQFTDALQTTYKILMIDTGADSNRDGNLNNFEESMTIPCTILKEIENSWKDETHGRCSFYGVNGVDSESPSCTELGGNNLTQTLITFPPSQFIIETRLQSCKI